MSGAEDALTRAEQLLERLEAARRQLEATKDEDADRAIEVLQELAEITREIDAELQRARRAAEADAADA